ncbi:peptide ABC transporter ATP-binding protein, partial [Amycolatopsis alba DSM 44262]
ILISHDIAVVSQTCERMLVMYAGRVVEDLPSDGTPRHPYTKALLAATLDLETDRDAPLAVIPGRPPEPDRVPTGCAFADRCPLVTDRCRLEDPVLERVESGHRVACWETSSLPDKETVTAGGAE